MRRIMVIVAVAGVWIGVAAAMIGFVLPWATMDLKAARLAGQWGQAIPGSDLQILAGHLASNVGRVTLKIKRGAETITGELPDLSKIPTSVNGPQIPEWTNRQDSQVVMALAEMLAGQRDLGAKSYAVYLLPGLALLVGVLVTLAGRARAVCVVLGAACLAIAGLGFWKLLTTKTDTLLVAITIGPGLWLSCWAYTGLGVCALLRALYGGKRGVE